jgi:hypothetical protein
VPDAGEPLSPQTADLVRRIARVILDEPADLIDGRAPASVSAQRHSPTLTRLATASRRDIEPAATVTSCPVDLQPSARGGTPLCSGSKMSAMPTPLQPWLPWPKGPTVARTLPPAIPNADGHKRCPVTVIKSPGIRKTT